MKELDLGTGNIGSLIKRFSIPCVISMVVAALYNIVDQIFICRTQILGLFGGNSDEAECYGYAMDY